MARAEPSVVASLKEHRPLAILVAGYAASCLLLRLIVGYDVLLPIDLRTYGIWWRYTLIALGFPVAYHLVDFHVRYLRESRRSPKDARVGIAKSWSAYAPRHFSAFRIAGVVVVCAVMSVLMSTFWAYKRAIPLFNPFSWDPAFMRLDGIVHLGTQPWRLLQPLFGTDGWTVLIDFIYVLWLPVLPLVIAWQAWSLDRELRGRFFMAYALSSVLIGTLMATLFSSAGPCYYAGVVGTPDPYGPLLSFLRDVDARHPLKALEIQGRLWNGYIGAEEYQGISAMPSVHVALPVLYVLAGFRTKRWLGWLFLAFLVATLLGSVHLGWHYAIDGYVGIVVVLIVWKFLGRFYGLRGPAGEEEVPAAQRA